MPSATTLDQLRVLVAVAEEGSFSAAGRRLRRVQSAISQSVHLLESNLGVQLFDRTMKAPALTEAGRALLVQARQVLSEATALEAQATAIGLGVEPELTLAVDHLLPSHALVAPLQGLRRRFPDLPVTLSAAPILAAERLLSEGAASIALCPLRPGASSELVTEPLTSVEMAPVVAPDHPLAGHSGPVSREMLSRHVQLILTDLTAPPDAPQYGVIGTRVWRFVDLGRRLDFLLAGFGWGNMPGHMTATLIKSGALVRLQLSEPSLLPNRIPIHAAYWRNRPPGRAGRWFLDQVRAACRETSGPVADASLGATPSRP